MLHKQVEPIFERLNLQCRDESTLQSKLMYGHYLCNSDGDELILYDMHDTKREIEFMTASHQDALHIRPIPIAVLEAFLYLLGVPARCDR